VARSFDSLNVIGAVVSCVYGHRIVPNRTYVNSLVSFVAGVGISFIRQLNRSKTDTLKRGSPVQ